jgi:hypothetical protein
MKKFRSLFNFAGTVNQSEYFGLGMVAMVLKYLIDRQVAAYLEHRPWEVWNYVTPLETAVRLMMINAAERYFLIVMTAVALPFVWLGLSLTTKRLRSSGLPLACVVLFFIPFINILMFLLLCVLPAGSWRDEPSDIQKRWSAMFAIVTSLAICLVTIYFATRAFEYGWALFVGTPFCLGLISSCIYSWKKARSQSECMTIALLACAAAAIALLCFAFEGVICLLMAAPLAVPLAILGSVAGYHIQPHKLRTTQATAMFLLFAGIPVAAVHSESKLSRQASEFVVTSSIEVNAPPEVVWKNVVTFSQLPPPKELLFKSGIAYPIRAEIYGTGVGAVRHCVFSTGPFIEPITIWDEPRLLEFSVSQIPAPMNELSPYEGLHPPHLDGFFVSKKGHFVLTPLHGGGTRLTGETWYSHNLWPEAYWGIWSDEIIHRIHLRVLNHIKELSEQDVARSK